MSIKLDQELAYFLPPAKSGMEKKWMQRGNRQSLYAQCCQHGMNKVTKKLATAFMQRELVGDGQALPSIKDLYKTAARVRFETATLMQKPADEWQLYGQPMLGYLYDHHWTGAGRWDEFHIRAAKFIRSLWSRAQKDPNLGRKLYGDHITLATDIGKKGPEKGLMRIAIFQEDTDGELYCLGWMSVSDNGDFIRFNHALFESRDKLFGYADTLLHQMWVAQQTGEQKKFWNRFAELELTLFHAGPCRLGSQTTTLMVMAGIQKAFRYEVIPMKPETDHFMDAEIIPHRKYIEEFLCRSSATPRRIYTLKQVAEVPIDDMFFERRGIEKKWQDRHQGNSTESLTVFLKENIYDCNSFSVKNIDVSPDGNVRIKISSSRGVRKTQKYVDYFVDFLGSELLIKAYGLEPGL
jgi:hypothetical protein